MTLRCTNPSPRCNLMPLDGSNNQQCERRRSGLRNPRLQETLPFPLLIFFNPHARYVTPCRVCCSTPTWPASSQSASGSTSPCRDNHPFDPLSSTTGLLPQNGAQGRIIQRPRARGCTNGAHESDHEHSTHCTYSTSQCVVYPLPN